MPLVSVIMPSFNHEQFISEAIESVLGQTADDLELIVVDDGSRDRSKEIIESYQTRDTRIRAFFSSRNQGISRTVNRGMKEASGEFMAFLSSDDVWFSDKLEKQLAILGKEANIVLYADVLKVDSQGKSVDGEDSNVHRVSKGKSGNILRDLLNGNFIPGQTMIFKKRSVDGITYDENLKYLNDWKFVLEMAKKYEFRYIPQRLAKYRVHGTNSILHDRAGWLNDFAIFGRYILDEFGGDISSKTKAKYLFRIGCNDCSLGNLKNGREHILRAMVAYPFKIEYWRSLLLSFFTNAIVPASLRRRAQP